MIFLGKNKTEIMLMTFFDTKPEADPDGCSSSCCYCQIVKSEFKNYGNRKRINHGKKFRFVNYIESEIIRYLLALVE